MSLPSSAPPPPSPASRLMRGYGPLFAFAVLFMLMAALVPTVGTEIKTVAAAGPGGGPAANNPTAGDGTPAGTDAYAPDANAEPGAGADGATTATSGPLARGNSRRRQKRQRHRKGLGRRWRSSRERSRSLRWGEAGGRCAQDRRLRNPQGAGTQRPVLPALYRILGR